MSTYETYNSLAGIRASWLSAGAVSMKAMRYVATAGRPDTQKMRWGRAVHLAILEPLAAWDRVRVFKGSRKAGSAYDGLVDEAGDPAFVLTPDELADLQAISKAVHANGRAHELIAGSKHEVTNTWHTEAYGRGKCRYDGLTTDGFFDLKTTRTVEQTAFGKHWVNMGYDIQAGWYAEGWFTHYVGRPLVDVIAVQSAPPYDVIVKQVPNWAVERGCERAVAIATEYEACCKAGRWPGVSEDYTQLVLPAWYADGAGEVPSESMDASEIG